MSFKCVLSSCQRDKDLICSPEDRELLLKWQNALALNETEFYVCSWHFDDSSFEVKKVLRENAVPSDIFEELDKNDWCECCFNTLSHLDVKNRVGKRLQVMILKYLDVEVEQSCYICFACKEKLELFVTFADLVKQKQKIYRTQKNKLLTIKEEPPPEIAEILIASNLASDPFECEDFIKEESSIDCESKYEPEIRIFEEYFTNEQPVDVGNVPFINRNLSDNLPKREKISTEISSETLLNPAKNLMKCQDEVKNETSFLCCDFCNRTYCSKNSLLKHIRLHMMDSKVEKLDHKKDALDNQCELRPDTKKLTVDTSKSCPICHKTMKSNSIYSHIRLVHNKERDQICQVCGKALKTSYDLKVHLRKHSGERPEICETCGKTFISYAQLYKHRKVRHMIRENYQCLICMKNLLSRFKLKCHTERFHPDGFDNGMRVNEDTNCYHCKICPLQFIAMHKYEKHLELNDCHKYEGLVTVEDVKMAKNAKGEFKCQECGSILNTMKGLKKHMRFVHPKEPQSCKICFKQLKNPHTLWQHMTLSHKQPVKKRKL